VAFDVGKAAPQESLPIIFYWSPWPAILRALPALATVLLLCVLRPNWHWQAWLVLLPLAVTHALTLRIDPCNTLIPPTLREAVIPLCRSLASAFALLWVSSIRLERLTPSLVALSSLGLAAIVGILTAHFTFDSQQSSEAYRFIFVYNLSALAIFGSFLLARRIGTSQGHPWTFYLWLLLCLQTCSLAVAAVYLTREEAGMAVLFAAILTRGLALGVLLSAIAASFLIVARLSPLYHRRLTPQIIPPPTPDA